MIKNFNTISFTFLISNLIAMPLLGISIIGGFLLVLLSFIWLWGAKQVGIIFNLILKALMFIAKFCGNLKLSNIYVITPNTIIIIIYYFIGALVICLIQYREKVVARRGCTFSRKHAEKKCPTPMRCDGLIKINYKKVVVVVLVLVLLAEIPWSNYNGKLKIHFIDVGQRR